MSALPALKTACYHNHMNWIFITITDGTKTLTKFTSQSDSYVIGDEIGFSGINAHVVRRRWTHQNELLITVAPF